MKVAWKVFKSALIERVGVRRAQTIFSEQTGYPSGLLQWWRRRGSVPVEAMEKLAEIEVEACDNQRFKGFHTSRFGKRVVELSNQTPTPTIKEIADILSGEFERKITEGSVKATRYRLKDQISGYKSRQASKG